MQRNATILGSHTVVTCLSFAKVISPLLARAHCECTDEEALTLIRNATRAAEEVSDHFKVTPESWQIWLDRQRETEQL